MVYGHEVGFSQTLNPAGQVTCPAGTKLSDKFTGVVTEVVSGDTLVVKDAGSGLERRVNLSSIRAARLGRKGEKPEDWALEAKEFLRSRLIGEPLRLPQKELKRSRLIDSVCSWSSCAPDSLVSASVYSNRSSR